MRLLVALVVPLLLAGCTSFSNNGSSNVSTTTQTIHEETLALGPGPGASANVTFEVPANTSELDVQLTFVDSLNPRADGPGCTTASGAGNVQVGVASRQTIGMRCDAPRAGPFTISVSREAGSGDVDVRVSGKITQTTAR